jgi:DNA-binding transcriptional MocR family regulator
MLRALDEHMPATMRWTRPDGGMFLWLTLPEQFDSLQVLERAVARKVAFVPGEAFHANGGGRNTMRLNFSYSNHSALQQGVERLASVLGELESA